MHSTAYKLAQLLLFVVLAVGVAPSTSLAAIELLEGESNSSEQEVHEVESALVSRPAEKLRRHRNVTNLNKNDVGSPQCKLYSSQHLSFQMTRGHSLRDDHSAPLLT